MPFARETSELFDRPSVSLRRGIGGGGFYKVAECCVIDVAVRYLPGQDSERILADVRTIPDTDVEVVVRREPAVVERDNPYVDTLADVLAGEHSGPEALSVGRDGASDIVSFLNAGVPGVEFGPVGAGHHGPEEWVSLASLERYRVALVDVVNAIPSRIESTPHLRIA